MGRSPKRAMTVRVTRRCYVPCLGLLLMVLAVLVPAGDLRAVCTTGSDCNTPSSGTTPPPAVTDVSPRAGASTGGTTVDVTLNRTVFQHKTYQVKFGSKLASSVKVIGQNQLQVVSPAHAAGRVDVSVNLPYKDEQDPGGWTQTGPGSSPGFFYCNGACTGPSITSITPAMGSAAGGTPVTIDGNNLTGFDVVVQFGSQTVTTICSSSSTEMVVFAPPAAGQRPGAVPVTVSNLNGTSNAVTFTYVADPVVGSHLDDNRNRFTAASLLGLSGLPSFLTSNLPGITGRVITHPAVHDLFWDNNWNRDNPALQQSAVATKVGELVHSSYLGAAEQYGVETPTTTGEDASSSLCLLPSAGSFVDPIKLTAWITCEAGGGPSADTEVPGTGGIQGLPLIDGLPLADDNTDYVIFLPAGSTVGLPFLLRSCKSNGGQFDDFHFFTVVSQVQWGSFLGIPTPEVEYQTVPYIVAPVDCSDGTVGGLVDGVSHELVESATDPVVGLGWIENSQFSFTDPTKIFMDGEASDICEKAGNGSSATFGGLTVERYWSNQDNACVPRADCTAPRLLKRPLPPPHTPSLKVSSLHPAALAALRHVRAFTVHGSVHAKAYGPGSPRVSSVYTIEQQGRDRALFEGQTKIDGGRLTRFEIVQVGGRRCARGARRWVCQNHMPPLDARAIVAEMMRRQFSAPSHTLTAHGLTTIRTIQANVVLSSALARSHGLPTRLADVARVGGKPLAAENVVFDYAPQPAITLPK